MNSYVTTAGYIYIGQAVAFSLCILLVGVFDWRKAAWLSSNVFGVAGVYFATSNFVDPEGGVDQIASALVVLATCMKALALGDGRLLSRRSRVWTATIALSLLIMVGTCLVPSRYLLLGIAVSGLLSTVSCIGRLLSSRHWRGSPAYFMMLAALVPGVLAMAPRLLTAYPFGVEQRFLGQTPAQLAGTVGVIVISFFMQFSFIGLLSARVSRQRLRAERGRARAAERTRAMAVAKAETDRLAEERLGFVRMLTHQVRQPMNNAQAALQAVSIQLSSGNASPAIARQAVRRTQDVLDEIVLTLSNAIAGSTLIERGVGVNLQNVEIMAISQIAIFDCQLSEQHRIRFRCTESQLHLDCDPILLRLCLRNLLDNAVKYSPGNSPVTFQVVVDDEQFGIKFIVTNHLADPLCLHGNIFERGKPSVDKVEEGYGVGLFIVSETARIHRGSLSYYQIAPDLVSFEMFLPI